MRTINGVRLTAVIGATLLLGGVAEAGSGGGCASPNACLYENNDYNNGNTDHWRDFTADHGNFNNLNWLNHDGSDSGDGMDNETSSIKNRRGCSVVLYQNISWGGAASTFGNGTDDGFLSNNTIGDNRASSIDLFC